MGDAFVHVSLAVERNLSDTMFIGLKAAYNEGLSGARPWEANGLPRSTTDPFRSFQLSASMGFVLR
jgi:hypothetical protein